MKIVWAHNWFLDYRIPVFLELDRLTNHQLYLIYNKENIPERVHLKVKEILGDRAICLTGERVFTFGNIEKSGDFANKVITLRYQPGLIKTLNKINPDVVIGEGFFRWGIFNLLYSFFKRKAYVMLYERTPFTERNVSKSVSAVRKWLLNFIDVVCVNGTLTRKYIESLGYESEKITEKHMVADIKGIKSKVDAVDLNEINILRDNLKVRGLVYLFVGQLIPRKGVTQLLDAWNLFSSSRKDFSASLVIIGDGPMKNDYIKMSQGDESVKFIGPVDHDELHKFLSMADVFVMPTLEDNWSMVVPEAMASSLPIITTKFNGCHIDLVDESNGWVIDPYKCTEFVDAIEKSYDCANDLFDMGKSSVNKIQHYSPEIAGKSILDSCLKAIKNK